MERGFRVFFWYSSRCILSLLSLCTLDALPMIPIMLWSSTKPWSPPCTPYVTLGDCLKTGILSQGSLPQNLPDDHLVVEAYDHQTSLGWEAFFCGRISHKWQTAYAQGIFTPKQSLKWAGKLVNFLLHYSQQLWNFRCSVVHGQTTEEAKKKLQATLLLQV